jgi:hypothetical protein
MVLACVLPAGVLLLGLSSVASQTGYSVEYIREGGAESDSTVVAVEYHEPWSAEQWWTGAVIMFSAWTLTVALPLLAFWLVEPLSRRRHRPWRAPTVWAVIVWGAGISSMSALAAAVHRANWNEWWAFAPTEPAALAVMTESGVGREAGLMYVPAAVIVCLLVVLTVRGYLRLGSRPPHPDGLSMARRPPTS